MNNTKIYTAMVFTAFFWSGAFIAGKLCVPYIPTYTLTFLRFLFAAAVMAVVLMIQNKKTEGKVQEKKEGISPAKPYRLQKKHVPIFLFTGIVGMVGYHVFFFASLKYTTAINSSIIAAMNPSLTMILAALFLSLKVPARQAAGVILSFVGVVLTITGGDVGVLMTLSFNKGDILMFVAIICFAFYSVFSRAKAKDIPSTGLTFYSFLVCTIFLIPFVIWEKPWTFFGDIPSSAWLGVLYMSVFASVLGYLIQQVSFKRIGASRTNIFINVVPVFSIILAVIILGEELEIIKIFTAAMIICGVIMCQLPQKRKEIKKSHEGEDR